MRSLVFAGLVFFLGTSLFPVLAQQRGSKDSSDLKKSLEEQMRPPEWLDGCRAAIKTLERDCVGSRRDANRANCEFLEKYWNSTCRYESPESLRRK